jgi:hypothetical protein
VTCGSCFYTDGCCYTTNPPKVKCVITNEFHLYGDECDCEEARNKREAEEADGYIKYSGDKLVTPDPTYGSVGVTWDGKEPTDYTLFTAALATPIAVACTPCLCCGESITLDWYSGGPKICENCQKAIKFIKERFKEELINYEVQRM